MDLKITTAGGRSLSVRSASGDIEAEWSREADGVQGIIVAGGRVIGSAKIDFRRGGNQSAQRTRRQMSARKAAAARAAWCMRSRAWWGS